MPTATSTRLSGREQRDHTRRQTQSHCQTDLRIGGELPAFVSRRVFECHEHRAAPFAAQPDALQQAQEQQDQRRRNADAVVGRHESDEERRNAHDRQRNDQQGFAPELVTEVSEENPAERARGEAHGIDGVGERGGDERVAAGEEEFVEHEPGDGPVQKEVVPLDGRADQAGQRDRAHRFFGIGGSAVADTGENLFHCASCCAPRHGGALRRTGLRRASVSWMSRCREFMTRRLL